MDKTTKTRATKISAWWDGPEHSSVDSEDLSFFPVEDSLFTEDLLSLENL